MTQSSRPPARQTLRVYPGAAFCVTNGANLGDGLGFADDLQPDDIYRLTPGAELISLVVTSTGASPFVLAPNETGAAADLHLDSALTFMCADGGVTQVIVLVETCARGLARQVYALPLAPLVPRLDYTLIGIDRHSALRDFAQATCTSFTAGTRITLATGAQRAVETLRPGDRILTRDNGVQELRWIGHQTLRAVGNFAPIRIRKDALNNAHDLLVSPDFRLFVYQRVDEIGAGRAEVMIRARHLLNGDSITRDPGGFVEYYQMLFDSHQIVYAEGIAAESMLLDANIAAVLPQDMADRLDDFLPRHSSSDARQIELQEPLRARDDLVQALRRASRA